MEIASQEELATGAFLLFFLVYFVFILAFYIYGALALQTIAKKTNALNSWMAWVPIANIYLMCLIAKRPGWWVVLFFVPIANIIATIMIWMDIAVARGKENWWGILMLVPGLNLIVPGYLAWSK